MNLALARLDFRRRDASSASIGLCSGELMRRLLPFLHQRRRRIALRVRSPSFHGLNLAPSNLANFADDFRLFGGEARQLGPLFGEEETAA